jgi:hypothetical protein
MYTTGKRTVTTSRESKDGAVRVQVGIECNVQELEAIVAMIAVGKNLSGDCSNSPGGEAWRHEAWAEEILAILGGSEYSKPGVTLNSNGTE